MILPSGFVPDRMIVSSTETKTGAQGTNYVTVDNNGQYSLFIATLTTVYFTVSIWYGGCSAIGSVGMLAVTSDKVLNLEVPGAMWNGRVVDENGLPVSAVTISGNSNAQDYTYGSDAFNIIRGVVTGVDGTFSVFVMQTNNYVQFTPPSGSRYMTKGLFYDLAIESSRPQIIILSKAVLLSGLVILPSGFLPDSVDVYCSTCPFSFESNVDSTGHYSLLIKYASPAYISVRVVYNNNNCQGYKNVANLTLTSDTVMNLVVGVMWNGTVVDGNGAPVAKATIIGNSQGKDKFNRKGYNK